MIEMLDFRVLGDERGSLVSLEQNKNIPFDIKRVYHIFGTKRDARRGFHAHRTLEQVLLCLSGNCKIFVDDDENRRDIVLDSPNKGLLLSGLVWREMYDFSENCVLMVLANDFYDESDYIRDYAQFLKEVKHAKS